MQTYSHPALGIDIGGTNCKAGLVDEKGNVIDHTAFQINHKAGIDAFLHSLYVSIDRLIDGRNIRRNIFRRNIFRRRIPRLSRRLSQGLSRKVCGIGVLLPGYLKENRTIPSIMVNIPMLENAPFYRLLSERYDVHVALDIDRNGPCMAEYLFCYKNRAFRLMYVTIGTGVGVGLCINGEICRVSGDSIGELGHLTLEPDGYPCVCGNRGCVETIVSIRGIARIADRLGVTERIMPQKAAGGRKNPNGSDALIPEAVYRKALEGDENARRVYREFSRYLGAALVTYANIFSPDLIVIGGGLAGASDLYIDIAQQYLNEHWFERKTKQILVRKTSFGEHAGIVGAASLVLP